MIGPRSDRACLNKWQNNQQRLLTRRPCQPTSIKKAATQRIAAERFWRASLVSLYQDRDIVPAFVVQLAQAAPYFPFRNGRMPDVPTFPLVVPRRYAVGRRRIRFRRTAGRCRQSAFHIRRVNARLLRLNHCYLPATVSKAKGSTKTRGDRAPLTAQRQYFLWCLSAILQWSSSSRRI